MSHNTDTHNSLLKVKNLKVSFPMGTNSLFSVKKNYIHAVQDVSFEVKEGEVFGIVGESGCGKSTTARSLVRLNHITKGSIEFEGNDVTHYSHSQLLQIRRNIQMIFQDPYASLNPRMTVGSLVGEPLEIFKNHKMLDMSKEEIEERVNKLLEQVGLRKSMKKRYIHEFSGGQRQRIGIARAVAIYPKLIVADEPVSALDVSIQAQILNLLSDLKHSLGLTYVFIAHDLSVINYFCDRVAVMYLGRIVEMGETDLLYKNPLHPYTKMLLDSILFPDPQQEQNRSHSLVKGEVEMAEHKGCPFYNRCPIRKDECKTTLPTLKEVQGRKVACIHYGH